MKSGVTTRVDNAQAIFDALKSIGKKEVLVGIPEAASSRKIHHSVMPGSVTSTNTVHRRKISPAPTSRTWR
jgi:hypothetical protein